jgi:hypothetical protein
MGSHSIDASAYRFITTGGSTDLDDGAMEIAFSAFSAASGDHVGRVFGPPDRVSIPTQ